MGDYTKQNCTIIKVGERKGELRVLGFGKESITTWLYSRPRSMTLYVPFSFGSTSTLGRGIVQGFKSHSASPGDLCLCGINEKITMQRKFAELVCYDGDCSDWVDVRESHRMKEVRLP